MPNTTFPARARRSDRAFSRGAAPLLALLAFSPAAAAEIEASSRVALALVYPRGATIERLASFEAPAGRHEVVIADLPVELDVDSLRVAGAGRLGGAQPGASFEILGISHKIREPRVEPLSEPERQRLLDRIEAMGWDLRAAEDALSEASARLDYMAAFRAATVNRGPIFARGPRAERKEAQGDRILPAGGRGDPGLFGVSGQWSEAWKTIAAESAAARQAMRDAERERDKIAQDIDALRDELDQVGPPPPARSVLTVSLSAANAVADGALRIEYLTSKASWAPLYDLKLVTEGAAKPGLEGELTLSRRASVTQYTGEDWSNVRLSLSTARPSGRIQARTPSGLRAVLYKPAPPPRPRKDAGGGFFGRSETAQEMDDMAEVAAEPAPMVAQAPGTPEAKIVDAVESGALANYSGAGVVYEIPAPARIPGDGEARQVLIGAETATVDLVARATPAQEQSAYLYAMHKNLEAPLLPGRASIYRDGVFYGQFTLDYVAPSDETALPFGPLDDVKITHRVINRSQGAEGIFTSSNKQQSRFELSAQNLGETPRRITLFDAWPFTETEKIVITRTGQAPTETDIEGRRHVDAWTFELAPAASRTIPFGYDIAWPEGEKLQLRR